MQAFVPLRLPFYSSHCCLHVDSLTALTPEPTPDMRLRPISFCLSTLLLCASLLSQAIAQTNTQAPVNAAPAPAVLEELPDLDVLDQPPDISIDLWERIRRGFGMQDLQIELVQDRERWYAQRPDYIQRMTARSSKYLYRDDSFHNSS